MIRVPGALRRAAAGSALALLSTLLALALGEALLRLQAYRGRQEGMQSVLSRPPEQVGGVSHLQHIIRLSPNPRLIYELRPNLRANYLGVPVVTNSQGFRSPEYSPHPAPEAIRILGLGDSFMFGQGVDEGRPYLAGLEGMLNRAGKGKRYEVINAAVPGYNTVMEVEMLREHGLLYHPEIVLLEWVGNDLCLPNFIEMDPSPMSLRHLFLKDWLRERFDRSFRTLRKARPQFGLPGLAAAPADPTGMFYESDPGRVPPEYRDLVGWDAFARALDELRRLRDLHGFRLLFFTSMSDPVPLKMRVLEQARNVSLETLDIGLRFRAYLRETGQPEYAGSTLALGPADGHPSALGHQLVAEELFKYWRPGEPVPPDVPQP